jgi:hypothetical protein
MNRGADMRQVALQAFKSLVTRGKARRHGDEPTEAGIDTDREIGARIAF